MSISKEEIAKLIEKEKRDSMLNHFVTILLIDYRLVGEICKNHITLWKQSGWNATFYPVFRFELNQSNQLVKVTEKINPVGKSILGILIGVIAYLFYSFGILELDFAASWPILMIIIAFISISVIVARTIYNYEKKCLLEDIYHQLGIEYEKGRTKKIWSLKRFLIRLIVYPICAFLIGLNGLLLIPEGQYGLALVTLAIVILFISSDLKILTKKTTTTNNN